MKRYIVFGFAITGYIASIISLSYLILWLYPWDFMPYGVDKPMVKLTANPWLVDILLILLFGLQHSLMARSFFKEGIMKRANEAIKMASYALASSIAVTLIVIFWQPIDGVLWEFESGLGHLVLTLIYIVGWVSAFAATFMIDHFGLFGLSQGYRYLKGRDEPKPEFQIRYFYKYVRHPIQAGTMIGLFATPVMSYSHLLFSVGMGLYILIGLYFEEKSLVREFGDRYREYKRKVPMLFPKLF